MKQEIIETEPVKKLFNESNRATFCMDDNKLRLYVGRVPRDEYEALRAEGWTSTPKQSEAGQGEFAATWTPARRDRALSYAGIIEDEDAGPAERAADRAERFAAYRETNIDRAGSHADRYDAQPQTHGHQNYARAVRAADRHDKHAGRAVDAWSKAEYWQTRTAGVISHALYTSTPSVRMGRIKILEAELRRFEASPQHYPNWIEHTRLRLAYENQMLAACGGRAALVEMEAGGFLGSHQITKVNRSPVTGQVVSVEARFMSDCNQYGRPWADGKGPRMLGHLINIERMNASVYTPPTDEQRAEFATKVKDAKKAKAAIAKEKAARGENCPLINPTDDDAASLQERLNEHNGPNRYSNDKTPPTIARMTQAQYSANSGGSFSRLETVIICEDGTPHRTCYGRNITRHNVFKVRMFGSRVIIITDKPQKPIPWAAVAAARAKCPTIESMTPHLPTLAKTGRAGWHRGDDDENKQIITDGVYVGFYYVSSMSQFGLTDKGHEALKQHEATNSAEVAA